MGESHKNVTINHKIKWKLEKKRNDIQNNFNFNLYYFYIILQKQITVQL